MDIVVVILVLGAFLVLILKKFDRFIYYVSMVDILLRIIAYIASVIPIAEIATFFGKYFPTSVSNIIDMYSAGIFSTVLHWLLLANYIVFEWYLIRVFFKRK